VYDKQKVEKSAVFRIAKFYPWKKTNWNGWCSSSRH